MVKFVPSSKTMQLIYPKTWNARPHVTTEYDDSALTNQASESAKNIFMLGSATEGDPNAVYEVKSSAQAREIFGSGDLVKAMELIWNPSGDFYQNGGTVYAQRVENATQAKLTKGPLTFVSKIFGANANKINISLKKDAITNAYTLRVEYDPKTYAQNYTNLGNIVQISYGDLNPQFKTVAYQVDGSPIRATKFTLLGGDSMSSLQPIQSYDLTKEAYENMEKLLTAINEIPGIQASPLKSCARIKTTTLDLTTDDSGNSKSVEIGGRDNPTVITDFYGDLVYATRFERYVDIKINRLAQPTSVTATASADGVNVSAKPAFIDVEAIDNEQLQGGDDGYVPVSWSDKFNSVHGRNVYYIVPLTAEDNVHAELQEFLNEENVLGYNYMAFVGGGYNENFNTILNRQMALRSNRIGLVANSGYYKSLTGQETHIPAYLMAAYVAGIASSLDVGEAVTNKYMNLVKLDQNFSGDELNQLDENGVIAIEDVINRNATGGFRVVEDVTTYNSTNEPTKSYISLQELTDFLFDDLRIYLEENFIGEPTRQATGSLISSFVEAFLKKRVSSGLLASYNHNSIQCVINGNQAYVSFEAAPARELRTILVKGVYTNFTSRTNSADGQTDYSNGVNPDTTSVSGILSQNNQQTHYIDD